MKNKSKSLFYLLIVFLMFINFPNVSYAESAAIAINEVETKDANNGPDWVEIYNYSNEAVDISGWYVVDIDAGHKKDAVPLKEGTILEPGAFYVFEGDRDFTFGLGKNDSVTLYDKNDQIVDAYSWGDAHANGTYSRKIDGTGEWDDLEPTKGLTNQTQVDQEEPPVDNNPPVDKPVDEPPINTDIVINEIESNGDDYDWIEIYNKGQNPIDISGWFVADDGELSRLEEQKTTPLPQDSMINPGEFFIFKENANFSFGLGGNDKAILYDNNSRIVDSYAWEAHAKFALSRFPDGIGDFTDTQSTQGAKNIVKPTEENPTPEDPKPEDPEPIEEIKTLDWNGKNELTVIDKEAMFLEDSSGLDYHDGHLWAVDNGTGKIWKLKLDENGNVSKAQGYENGKKVIFGKYADNPDAKSPDSEGITLDNNGYVYIASERDNNQKGTNFNSILMVAPESSDSILVPIKEWDLTALLPQVAANSGIETVEWISNNNLRESLFDINTNKIYDPASYADQSINDGLFFVGLEDNGHIYAFMLSKDNSAKLISEIDTKVGGVMGLDFDEETKLLWAESDDGFKGVLTTIEFNGTSSPTLTHYNPPKDMDLTFNNEGYAIAPSTYGPSGYKPVYWFMDGVAQEALRMGLIKTDEVAEKPVEEKPVEEKPTEQKPSEEKPADDKTQNNKPADKNSSDKKNQNTSKTKSPNTSDFNLYPFYFMAVLGLVTLSITKKEKSQNN